MKQFYLKMEENRNKALFLGQIKRKLLKCKKKKVLLSTAKFKKLRRLRTTRLIKLNRLIIVHVGKIWELAFKSVNV